MQGAGFALCFWVLCSEPAHLVSCHPPLAAAGHLLLGLKAFIRDVINILIVMKE